MTHPAATESGHSLGGNGVPSLDAVRSCRADPLAQSCVWRDPAGSRERVAQDGAVGKERGKNQAMWLVYRDAWVKFAAIKYPEIDADALNDRTRLDRRARVRGPESNGLQCGCL